MKSLGVRIIYLLLFIVAIVLLYLGHKDRRPNQIILGTGILFLALFICHYPLSWTNDYGV